MRPLAPEVRTFEAIRHPRRWAFLVAFATCTNITRAAQAAGVNRRRHTQWLKLGGPEGDAYRATFTQAKAIACDVLVAQ